MIRKKEFKSIWVIGIVLFQLLPIGIIVFFAFGFRNYSDQEGWMFNVEKDCKVYTHSNFQNRHFNWNGLCENGFAQGQGRLIVYEGRRQLYQFEGELQDGRIEGNGKWLILSDGNYYEGAFKNGRLHGLGHYYNDDGDHYEGFYENGLKSGWGTYWYPPESLKLKYEGQWKNNLENGEGRIFYRNGKITSGVFEMGKLQSTIRKIQQPVKTKVPKNILITNDDGVEDLNRLKCLAEKVSQFADVVVVAVSNQNRSGTSNNMIMAKQGYINVKCLSADSSKQIFIYEVQGYPADCVIWAGLGFFQKIGKNIDLVLSGINGGPNIGVEWFGSGTIGAARTAALAGIPAIAISGIDEDKESSENLERICNWVAAMAQTPLVGQMKAFEYLTVSIPEDLDEIKGTKFLERAVSFNNPPFYLENKTGDGKIGEASTWVLKEGDPAAIYDPSAVNDVNFYSDNYIVIVPMSVNENNLGSLPRYKKLKATLPSIN